MTDKRPSKKKKIILLIILALVLISVGIGFYLKNNEETEVVIPNIEALYQYTAPGSTSTLPVKEVNSETPSIWAKVSNAITSLFASGNTTPSENKATQQEKKLMLEEIELEIDKLSSRFYVATEENGISYVDHVNKPEELETMAFYTYIGIQPDDYIYHRTIIRYSGTDSLALQLVVVQTNISNSFVVNVKDGLQAKHTTKYNEWIDLPPMRENNELLNSVSMADEVVVRFIGDSKNVSWKLAEKELTSLRETIYFYNLLKKREELLTDVTQCSTEML